MRLQRRARGRAGGPNRTFHWSLRATSQVFTSQGTVCLNTPWILFHVFCLQPPQDHDDMCWARIHGDAPSSLPTFPVLGRHGTNDSPQKEQSYNCGTGREHQGALPTSMVLLGLHKAGYFVGAARTHPERRHTSWDTHSKRPFSLWAQLCFRVRMMLPQNTPGSLGKERDTRVSERTPVETSPRVAISGSIHRFRPSCPHPGSRRANTQTTSIGGPSEGLSLAQRNFREERPVGARGALRRARPLPWSRAEMETYQGGGFTIQIRVNSTHSQLSDGDLNLYSVRREKLLFLHLRPGGMLNDPHILVLIPSLWRLLYMVKSLHL